MIDAARVSVPTRRRPLRELLPTGDDRLLVAIASAGLVAGTLVAYGVGARALVGLVLLPTLAVLATIDVRHRLLPNAIVLPAALATAAVVGIGEARSFTDHLWAGLALFGFLFVFAVVVPGGIGMGDAKLGLLIGLALGGGTLPAMVYALFGAFLAAVWILVRGGLTARKRTIPFGPYMALGAVLAFFLT